MEEKKSKFCLWVKAHKKQLIISGVGISVLFGIILGIKNKDVPMELWAMLERRVRKEPQVNLDADSKVEVISESVMLSVPRNYTCPQEPVPVCLHVRNLGGGRVHSAEKAAEADALGIILSPNQTLVDSYTKYAS